MFLTESPRDAMQNCGKPISAQQKIDYINTLMDVGYDMLDCIFFSTKNTLHQTEDYQEVLDHIVKTGNTKIAVMVSDLACASLALEHPKVDVISLQFSISRTYQQKINSLTQLETFEEIKEIVKITNSKQKPVFLYFSMAFGNPYGEKWTPEEVVFWAKKALEIGVKKIILEDTNAIADENLIKMLLNHIGMYLPLRDFGLHLHHQQKDSYKLLKTAYESGCHSFESSIKGIAACPMANDLNARNTPTEKIINFLQTEKIHHPLNLLHFEAAWNKAKDIFKF